MNVEMLRDQISAGDIDTVLVCLVDMQGRLLGKRLHAEHFFNDLCADLHCPNYLLATDLDMRALEGFASANWQQGFGDYALKPDLSTLRPLPWLQGTALLLCDVLDPQTRMPVAHSPRQMLKVQVERARAMGLTPMMGTEIEFFLFEGNYDSIRKDGLRHLVPMSGHSQDYSILQTTKEEITLRPLRNHLVAAGVPVECTRGEAETGQVELNVRYADVLTCADHHIIAKHAAKEIAWANGMTASFLAKWHHDKAGSAAHVHQSLWCGDTAAFYEEKNKFGMSDLMGKYLAGLLKYTPDCMFFMAPYVNSYKRFRTATFAPTSAAWAVDNRTAGFRVCGVESEAIRIECRIPGADINPHLACAAQLAAGLAGIEEGLALPPPVDGNVHHEGEAHRFPHVLRDAIAALRQSNMLRSAMGDAVVDHYVRAAEVEQQEFDRVVTDWEVSRGFERA